MFYQVYQWLNTIGLKYEHLRKTQIEIDHKTYKILIGLQDLMNGVTAVQWGILVTNEGAVGGTFIESARPSLNVIFSEEMKSLTTPVSFSFWTSRESH